MSADALSGAAGLPPGSFGLQQVAALSVGPTVFVVLENGRVVAQWRCRDFSSYPAFTLHEDGSDRLLLDLEMQEIPGSRSAVGPFKVTDPRSVSLGTIGRAPTATGPRLTIQAANGQALNVTFAARHATIDHGVGAMARKPIRKGLGRYPADNYEIEIRQPLAAPLPALLLASALAASVWSQRAMRKPGGKHLLKDVGSAVGGLLDGLGS